MSGGDDTSIVSSRVIAASPVELFDAIRDPRRIARWWGPEGFTNTFRVFDFREGGEWVHDMRSPDGRVFPNRSVFEEVGPRRVVIRHLEPVHAFTLTMEMEPSGGGTRLVWTMVFNSPDARDEALSFVPQCNEENFDRLERELGVGGV